MSDAVLSRCRVVLVRPQFAGNVGAAARVMRNMGLSDLVLGFYPGSAWVYGSFALIVLIGMALRRGRTPLRIGTAAIASSVLFFAVTNFGEWLGPLYPHTMAGLRADFVAAIPFFRNTVLSDLLYAAAFFGAYDSAARLARQRAAHLPSAQRTT